MSLRKKTVIEEYYQEDEKNMSSKSKITSSSQQLYDVPFLIACNDEKLQDIRSQNSMELITLDNLLLSKHLVTL